MRIPQHIKTQYTKYQCLNIYEWSPDNSPKACVVIIHGMMEHAQRYQEMASYLNDVDILVYSLDLPGHGQTGIDGGIVGHLPKTGWQWACESILLTLKYAQKKNPDLPLFLLGHSMGSYLAQIITTIAGDSINGLILSGTSYENPRKILWANKILKFMNNWIHEAEEVRKIQDFVFNPFNKVFKPNNSNYDWLTKDTEIIKRYEKDNLCGTTCSLGFYRELTLGLYALYSPETFNKLEIYNSLPILFQYGQYDPLSNGGKTIKTLIKKYEELGFYSIEEMKYPNARHEVYQEIERETVYHDLCHWIYQNIEL